jgi:hypothetical protein
MKAKLKGANGFVRFLLQHGEKIGIALVLVVAGLLIFKSLGREKLGPDKQPEKLKSLATNADGKVRDATWENIPEDQRTDAAKFQARPGDRASTPVNVGSFPIMSDIDPPAIPPVKPRTDPQLLAAMNLEVSSGSGLWLDSDPKVIQEKMKEAYQKAEDERLKQEKEQEKLRQEEEKRGGAGGASRGFGAEGGFRGEGRGAFGAMGGYGGMGGMAGDKTKDGAIVVQPRNGAQMQGFEDIRDVSWVTVMAKVPIKQQVTMYEDALANSRGFAPTADFPQYLGYIVERAEVTDENVGKWETAAKVSAPSLIKEMQRWPIQTPELVKPKYVHPLLTHPLPPMIVRQWDEGITHSEMPLPTPEELARGFVEETPANEPKAEEPNPNEPFGQVFKRTPQGQFMGGEGRGPSAMMGMGGRGPEAAMMMGRSGYGASGMGGRGPEAMMMGRMGPGMGGRGPEGGGMMGSGMSIGQTDLAQYAWDGKTEFILFRYFDSNVKPGHRYKYRVQLAMVDVNALQPPANLDSEVNARLNKERVELNKKPPEPRGYRFTDWSEESPVAVVPQPGLSFVSTVKSSSNQLAEPEAKMVIKSLDATNAAEIAVSDDFRRGSVLNLARKAQVIWSSLFKASDNQGKPQESPTFNFLTGMTLLDFEGGEAPVPRVRSLTAPARALMMDSAGRLTIHEELKDKKSIREFEYIMDAAKKQAVYERQQKNDEKKGGGRGRGG